MKPKFLSLVILSALWVAFTTGCNTTKGVGKDIEKAGNKIQDAAK
jgi:entericidin A